MLMLTSEICAMLKLTARVTTLLATGVPVVPGQQGIPGRVLTPYRPYSRDFFTSLAN